MTNPINLTLTTPQGVFVFSGAEVPEKIAFGGEQMLTTHKLVGGLRVVDAMGPDDHALAWSGWFLGSANPGDPNAGPLPDTLSATGRARFLDGVWRSGALCTLAWDAFSYLVVVSKFSADYEKPYKVPFQIACEVVRDNTKAVSSTATAAATPIDALGQDAASLSTLSAQAGVASVSGLVATAVAVVAAVTGAAKPIANGLVSLSATGGSGAAANPAVPISSALSATANSNVTSALNSALSSAGGALAALQGALSGQIGLAASGVAAVPVIGTLNPLQSVGQQAGAMTAQSQAAVQLGVLQQMGNIASRMQANLALVANPGGTRQMTTGGGNLYGVAAQAYGDATRWGDIAQASGLSDPMTPGFNTITIPSS